ncbi:MAG: hypothetical protein DDT19_00223 [Syntrophomonadaceae bacterium]|nr:hypothetical protein [Bacillota bacterium]
MITFSPETHEYKKDGLVIPSVTQIIADAGLAGDFSFVPSEVLEKKREVGKIVHLACVLYEQKKLDEDRLNPVLAGYLESWKKFVKISGYVSEEVEKIYYSERYHFAGTIDTVGIKGKGKTIIEIKTGTKKMSDQIQTAGYELLYNENNKDKVKKRLAVYLKENGDIPTVQEHKDKTDSPVFLACLTLMNFKQRR